MWNFGPLPRDQAIAWKPSAYAAGCRCPGRTRRIVLPGGVGTSGSPRKPLQSKQKFRLSQTSRLRRPGRGGRSDRSVSMPTRARASTVAYSGRDWRGGAGQSDLGQGAVSWTDRRDWGVVLGGAGRSVTRVGCHSHPICASQVGSLSEGQNRCQISARRRVR